MIIVNNRFYIRHYACNVGIHPKLVTADLKLLLILKCTVTYMLMFLF